MQIGEILSTRIMYQKNFWAELSEIPLGNIFEEIKSLKHLAYTRELSKLYSNGDTELYSVKKKSLPVAAFAATFSNVRSKIGFLSYNQLIVLDIDKLDTYQLSRTQLALQNDPYIVCHWKSPSQNGIKALVRTNYEGRIDHSTVDIVHKYAFAKVSNYFFEKYQIELDKSGSDFTRLCFISYDPDFNAKEVFQVFDIDPTSIPTSKDVLTKPLIVVKRPVKFAASNLYNASGKNRSQHKKMIQNIISYLSKNSKSITFHYDDWLRVGFAIANSFTYDVGIRYFKALSKNDVTKFDPIQCENLLSDCYQNSRNLINFVTIIHLAKNQGFVANRTNREST
ncbi:BT4734/BF3469 family protein [Dyadobacter sp. BHUBP1]|uniref:BT4734/BF3469 family protein n=1 Tax=Dyadobacter sp. BHUBP1 TaxID=3424178 RepID=UPI003D327955